MAWGRYAEQLKAERLEGVQYHADRLTGVRGVDGGGGGERTGERGEHTADFAKISARFRSTN